MVVHRLSPELHAFRNNLTLIIIDGTIKQHFLTTLLLGIASIILNSGNTTGVVHIGIRCLIADL